MPYVRTVKTTSGATAVQVVWSSRRGARQIEHLGSAHDDSELEALKAAAQQRITAGQGELDLGLEPAGGGPLPITSSKMSHLTDSLERAYRMLGLEDAACGDEVFRQLVLARIIEPTSKLDSLRVLDEAGVAPPSYRTLKRRLPAYAQEQWRQRLSQACAAHARLGPASLVLYDVTTLYFETDQGDGFREPGFSKERRLEPQITVGLLTDQAGFPLMLSAFEGNKGETKTMLPVIKKFMEAHQLPDVTVVADAGMISDANMKAIEAAGNTGWHGQGAHGHRAGGRPWQLPGLSGRRIVGLASLRRVVDHRQVRDGRFAAGQPEGQDQARQEPDAREKHIKEDQPAEALNVADQADDGGQEVHRAEHGDQREPEPRTLSHRVHVCFLPVVSISPREPGSRGFRRGGCAGLRRSRPPQLPVAGGPDALGCRAGEVLGREPDRGPVQGTRSPTGLPGAEAAAVTPAAALSGASAGTPSGWPAETATARFCPSARARAARAAVFSSPRVRASAAMTSTGRVVLTSSSVKSSSGLSRAPRWARARACSCSAIRSPCR